MVNVGVLVTRAHARTRYAANVLAAATGRQRLDPAGRAVVLLGTSTTTNLEKLVPRLERGDAAAARSSPSPSPSGATSPAPATPTCRLPAPTTWPC